MKPALAASASPVAYNNSRSRAWWPLLPPGSPFKTDKRDARSLARLLRAGELTAVYVPESTDEAIRGLVRRKVLRKLPGLRRILISRTEIHRFLNEH